MYYEKVCALSSNGLPLFNQKIIKYLLYATHHCIGKNRITIWSSNSTSRYSSQKIWKGLRRHLYIYVHSSIIHNSQKVEATQVSVNLDEWVKKKKVVCIYNRASLTAQWVKNPPAVQETYEMRVWSLGWEDPLEKEMATHSSIFAWKIPWTEESGGLQPTGSQRVGHDWA